MTVGEILRQARVRAGLDLDTVARDTRIGRRYLEAIEADNPAGVPGQFFYRSFVRQYAEALGLDPADLGQEMAAHPAPAPPPVHHAPVREPLPPPVSGPALHVGSRATTWISVLAFVAVVAGCSALYAWYHSRQVALPAAQSSPPESRTPAREVPPVIPPVQPASNPPATAESAPPQPVAPSGAAPSAPAPADTGASAGEKVRIEVSSKEPAWVSLTSDGKQVFAGTLQPGQVKTMGGNERAQIRVGNAGGIEVTFNGKPLGAIGPRGQVRTVVFTPEGYEIKKPTVTFEEGYRPGT